MEEETRRQVEDELRQIGEACTAEPDPSESLDELVARKRREQGINAQSTEQIAQ